MAKKPKKRKEIKKKLLYKYRLVILNENTFEEKISFKLSRLNVFVTGSLFMIGLIGLTTLLIAFTPLREYIPGYSSTRLKKEATELTYKTDSLIRTLNYTNKYLDNRGDIENNEINRDSLFERYKLDPSNINLTPIKEDIQLREQVELEDKYNLFERNSENLGKILFSPVSGTISQEYNLETKHFAIDIVAQQDFPVKSVADGTVIFSEWAASTGYVIIIEHKDDLISVYKHNGSLSKSQGEIVKAGDLIYTLSFGLKVNQLIHKTLLTLNSFDVLKILRSKNICQENL